MKINRSHRTNISLELITIVAATVSTACYSAIAKSQNASSVSPTNRHRPSKFPAQQQLISQLWSDLDSNDLTLALPEPKVESAGNELLITQLLPKQQQLIAQLWSDLDSNNLSLAVPQPKAESAGNELLITQLPPAQQQQIAQLWSDIDSNDLSLILPDTDTDTENKELLITEAELNPQQKLLAQTWFEFDADQLSLATPLEELGSVAALNDFSNIVPDLPAIKKIPPTPVAPIRSKEEIAARIILKKVQIITPAPGVIIDGNSESSVTVQYPVNTSVKLEVNGKKIDNALVTREQLDFKTNIITQTWEGATLNEGKNQVSVIASKGGFTSETNREVIVEDNTNEAETKTKLDNTNSATASETESKPQSTLSDEKASQTFVKILTPKPEEVLTNVSSSVIIQYPEEASVILQVNGKSVNPSQVGRTEVSPITKIVTQTWYGVVFNTGTNELDILSTIDGTNYAQKSIRVYVPGKPKALKIKTLEAHIPADGRSVATVQGEFLDDKSKTSPWNDTVTLNSSEGQFVGADLDPDRPGFQVRANKGKFSASLQAGYDAETVTIQAKSTELEAYTQIQFKNALREKPLLTGFANLQIGARGTDYYDSFRDFLPLDKDNKTEIDFDSAAFIVGSFSRWSYTGAYNSDLPLNEDSRGESRVFRTYSTSETNYPVYGDSSTSEVVTPSTDSLYLRLERNSKIEFAEPDYFMWGDYNTEEFATESQEFSAVTRQLHGFKSNYNLGGLQLSAFYANNADGFQRDAIAPDGTSGFYFLSRRLLIPGSEDVYLELTPLNDPGNVVDRQRLSLGIDYEIDYDRGTLLFNDPVLRTDVDSQGNILARRIVATYQFESEAQESTLLGGRARYHFNRDFERPTWLGMTYLDEDRGDLDFKLWGFDTYISLGTWGSVIGEYANSENQTVFADASGAAYRFEGNVKLKQGIRGRAYYRQADEGFANDATLSFIPGQTRYGSEVVAGIAKNTNLRFSYDRQENNGVAPRPLDELEDFLDLGFAPVPGSRVDNNLSTVSAGVEQKFGEAKLTADLRYRDRQDNAVSEDLDSTSTQLQSRFSTPIVGKLTFHALNDLTLSQNTDSVLSDRLGVGPDWEFYSGLSLVANHQWFTRGNLAGESLTTLGATGEYNPWANATLTGKYSIVNGVDGINNIGSMGLQQKIKLAAGLNLDLNYEHTFDSTDDDGTGTNFIQPFAVGQGASALTFGSGSSYSAGIEYTDNPDFTANAKWQHSDRSGGGNTVISGGLTGKLSSALTSLLSYNQASSANQTFDIGTTRTLDLGMAYRHPKNDKFNGLLRYQYEENGGLLPETALLKSGTGSQDHLFGVEAIYAPNWRWEFYSKYAFRHSKTFVADDFVGSSNISLGQLRTTFRLNYHMDLVAEARGIWQPSTNYTESGFLLEAGYYLTPELRISGGYVFGKADDDDFTGTRSAGGPYFGMTVKLNSLLDGFGQHRAPSPPEVIPKKPQRRSGSPHVIRNQKSKIRNQESTTNND